MLLFYLLSIFFIVKSGYSSSVNPLQFLINKLEKKMDTNIYYLLNYERQKNEAHFCLSSDGPYCFFLNGRFLGNDVKENSETIKLKQNVKLNAKNAIEKLNLDSKKPGENNVFYYSDKLRENLDEIYSNQGQFSGEEFNFEKIKNPIIEVFLDFENVPLEAKAYSLDFSFKILLLSNEELDKTVKEDYMAINMKNLYVPSKEKVTMRRSSLKKETIVEDFSEKIPNSVYMHTLEKEGTIFFSRPVKLGSFYLRKHDFAKYKEKNPKKTYVEFKVRGFLNLELVFELEYSNKNINFNAWSLIKISDQINSNIDSLIIDSNTDFDNLYFTIEDNIEYEITKEEIESLLEGAEEIKELEYDFKADDISQSEPPPFSQKMDSYKKNTQEKDIKNPFSDTYMKNSESKLKKNEFSEEFIEEIMNILNIQDLENIKLMDPENLQNKRKDFIKDIPEAQKLIDSGIDVSELEKELVEKIEKKHPGFKIIYKSAIEEAKLKKKNKKSSEKK